MPVIKPILFVCHDHMHTVVIATGHRDVSALPRQLHH